MNRIYYFIVLSVFAGVLFSCSGGSEKQDKVSSISELESVLYSDTVSYVINNSNATELIGLYGEFAEAYPKDSLSPEYLFKAAEIHRAMNDGEEAIRYYDKIISEYPEFDKAAYCLFLKAFVYENIIQNLLTAKKFYTEFIDKYPGHDFADDARILIENLGKSPRRFDQGVRRKTK